MKDLFSGCNFRKFSIAVDNSVTQLLVLVPAEKMNSSPEETRATAGFPSIYCLKRIFIEILVYKKGKKNYYIHKEKHKENLNNLNERRRILPFLLLSKLIHH